MASEPAHPDRGLDAGDQVTGDAAFQAIVLDELAVAVNYHRWIVALAMPFLGDDPLEVGSGTGLYAQMFAAAGQRITVSEAYPPLLRALRDRFEASQLVGVRELRAPLDEDAGYSAVLAVNVLEHVPDDVAALRSFARLTRPGGAVVLFVPAFPALMSEYDRRVGHQRRYTRRSLRRVVADAGLATERLHYVNTIGFFGWFVAMRLLHGRPKGGPVVRTVDRLLVPLMRHVEEVVPPPFGQSLFVVARHPDASDSTE